jgi:hypothetical protein
MPNRVGLARPPRFALYVPPSRRNAGVLLWRESYRDRHLNQRPEYLEASLDEREDFAPAPSSRVGIVRDVNNRDWRDVCGLRVVQIRQKKRMLRRAMRGSRAQARRDTPPAINGLFARLGPVNRTRHPCEGHPAVTRPVTAEVRFVHASASHTGPRDLASSPTSPTGA